MKVFLALAVLIVATPAVAQTVVCPYGQTCNGAPAVPFLVLGPQVAELRAEIDAATARVLDSGWYLLGKELTAFEGDWAAYCGAKHCVGLANGPSGRSTARCRFPRRRR